MNAPINVVLAMVTFGGPALMAAFWLSPRGCAYWGAYLCARARALPRKRLAIEQARLQYHRDMAEFRAEGLELAKVESIGKRRA